jgi:hypothetical protein
MTFLTVLSIWQIRVVPTREYMNFEFVKRLTRVFLYLIVLLLCCVAWWVVNSSKGGENLYGCDFILSSDKKAYVVGDEVRLKLSVMSNKLKLVHFYQNNEDTIYISPLENTEYRQDVSNTNIIIQEVALKPNVPFDIYVVGDVKSSEQPGMLLVDFHKLGRIVVKQATPIGFSARAYPVKTRLTDSVNWPFSNELFLTFQPSSG